jgi:hypothetical protein
MRALTGELHSSVMAARIAYEAIQSGYTGLQGSTGTILARRLKTAEEMSERMQALHTDEALRQR